MFGPDFGPVNRRLQQAVFEGGDGEEAPVQSFGVGGIKAFYHARRAVAEAVPQQLSPARFLAPIRDPLVEVSSPGCSLPFSCTPTFRLTITSYQKTAQPAGPFARSTPVRRSAPDVCPPVPVRPASRPSMQSRATASTDPSAVSAAPESAKVAQPAAAPASHNPHTGIPDSAVVYSERRPPSGGAGSSGRAV
jgi:hypothetical protein